jgi:hypothetical protein
MPCSCRYSVRSSAIRLVRVVTSTRRPGRRRANLVQQVIDLHLDRADFDLRVDQAGGADDLFGEGAAGLFQLPRRRGGGDEDRLRAHRIPFLELQRAVVHAGGQAEAVFGQGELAAEVAPIHAADLRHGDVGFVCENNGIVGDELEQRGRRLARARGRSASGNSSRSRRSFRWLPASPGQSWCAAPAAAPPAACPRRSAVSGGGTARP